MKKEMEAFLVLSSLGFAVWALNKWQRKILLNQPQDEAPKVTFKNIQWSDRKLGDIQFKEAVEFRPSVPRHGIPTSIAIFADGTAVELPTSRIPSLLNQGDPRIKG